MKNQNFVMKIVSIVKIMIALCHIQQCEKNKKIDNYFLTNVIKSFIVIIMKNPVKEKNYKPRPLNTEHYKHNFARKFIRDYYKKHHGKCTCCGQPIWKEHKKHKFCLMCSSMAKTINNRVHMQNKRDKRFKNIGACIELSDRQFKTVLCDGNCFECIFSDCILPEED